MLRMRGVWLVFWYGLKSSVSQKLPISHYAMKLASDRSALGRHTNWPSPVPNVWFY